jgi:aminoglycoside phosphotransferase (APT) family kinase protein
MPSGGGHTIRAGQSWQQLTLGLATSIVIQSISPTDTIRDEIGIARRDIVTRRAEVIAELRIIPSKIALAEVQATSAELRMALDKIDGVMTRVRQASRAADPLLRSTDELMTDATRPPATPSEFDVWLRSPNGG